MRIFILLLLVSCNGNTLQTAKQNAISYYIQEEKTQQDTLLKGVQEKIYNAFVASMVTKDNKSLSELSNSLENLYKKNRQNIVQYWRAYLQYYSSIYYLKKGDEKTAEKEIEKGIDWLKELKHKNSEDYALLAMLQGFSLQFNEIKAIFISREIKQNAQTSIALDSMNLRGYYVYASHDFYTPEKYGGGKECEKYLLKAISLPVQIIKNDYLPSWGKEESYEILIRYYIRKKEWGLAKKYYQEAVKLFPNSYTINKLSTKLVEE